MEAAVKASQRRILVSEHLGGTALETWVFDRCLWITTWVWAPPLATWCLATNVSRDRERLLRIRLFSYPTWGFACLYLHHTAAWQHFILLIFALACQLFAHFLDLKLNWHLKTWFARGTWAQSNIKNLQPVAAADSDEQSCRIKPHSDDMDEDV